MPNSISLIKSSIFELFCNNFSRLDFPNFFNVCTVSSDNSVIHLRSSAVYPSIKDLTRLALSVIFFRVISSISATIVLNSSGVFCTAERTDLSTGLPERVFLTISTRSSTSMPFSSASLCNSSVSLTYNFKKAISGSFNQ